MNKILILISFLFVFSLKINAYEYIVYRDNTQIRIYYDSEGRLFVKRTDINGNIITNNDTFQYFLRSLNGIKNNQTFYITKNTFDEILSNDLNLLNDFYSQQTQAILNYYYNNSNFDFGNYVIYNDYTILYDENGYAVESIVNGIWKGLYNTEDELKNSGWLYDKQNKIYYYNQYEASFIGQLEHKLLKFYKNVIIGTFSLNVIGIILIFIFACVILRIVLNLVHHFLTRSRFNFNIGKKF